jgi:DNA-binding MarR family transcriptional regulator
VQEYVAIISLIERLHRQFLELVRYELDRLGVVDINNVQSLILYNIGDQQLTVGELTARGCYLGSNVTYNLNKLRENDYVLEQVSPRDRRVVRISLSPKGRELCDQLGAVFKRHTEALAREEEKEALLRPLTENLRRLENFWAENARLNR